MSNKLNVVVFTDGAAKGNPGPGGWGAVIRVAGAAVRELGGFGGHTTNNRMEMTAALRALAWLRDSGKEGTLDIEILTDSTYLIRGVTQWIASWRKRGWKTAGGSDVANRDLWESLAEILAQAESARSKVRWRHVRGHSGIAGNERADAIASGFAAGSEVKLYEGPLATYNIDLDAVGMEAAGPAATRGSRSASRGVAKGPAACYLSVVDGVPLRHSTWTECELRVKGRSGARFKKAVNRAEEAAVLAEWGFTLDDLAGPLT